MSIPIGFDTDVNAPALAEITYGPHRWVYEACNTAYSDS